MKSIDAGDSKPLEAIFVSHAEILHVRNKTGEIPVVYVNPKGEVVAYKNHDHDVELVTPLLEDMNRLSSLDEIFSRIIDGITESVSSR